MAELTVLVAYILAGLAGASWALALGFPLSVGAVAAALILALLPDLIGHLGLALDLPQAERAGHSLWAPLLLAGLTLLLALPGGWLGVAAYSGHLLVDLLVDGRGVPLLWPLSQHRFYLASATGLFERLVILAVLAVLLVLPHLTPGLTTDLSRVVRTAPTGTATPTRTPTPTTTPQAMVIRISHVYDPEAEILVRPGDTLNKGQLVADLATYRRYHPRPAAAEPLTPATPRPTPTETASPTPRPSPTPGPTATATWAADPLAIAAAGADLHLAQAQATRAARPPSPTEVARVCDQAEQLRRKLWRDQIARDMSKAMEVAWEAIHVQEIDLDILEGDIARADAECEAIQARPHAASPQELAVTAAELKRAEIAYYQALASPSPPPVKLPTPTPSPSPTRTPSPTASPTVTPRPGPPVEDESRIYSKLEGVVFAVRLISITGNEAVVEIDVYPPDVAAALSRAAAAPPAPAAAAGAPNAIVERVVDGDTLKLDTGETVRLIGVDTPETKHPRKGVECFGPEASEFTQSLLPPGSAVRLEEDAEARDHYDRLLAYVWLPDGQMVNETLIEEGFARPLAIAPNTRHAAHFEALAAAAQAQGRGLWGSCQP